MKKPKQPFHYAVPSGEGTVVFAAWSFTQAVETKTRLQAEYAETHDRDRMFAIYEITGEEFDRFLAHEATAARMLDNGLVCFTHPVPNVP
jgi:hypothetical protein